MFNAFFNNPRAPIIIIIIINIIIIIIIIHHNLNTLQYGHKFLD